MTGEPRTLMTPPSTPSAKTVKVAIIEDHREFREHLTALVKGTEGYHCTGSFR